MAYLQHIRKTIKEIIELGSKSAILGDKKSKEFCQLYANLKNDSKQKESSYVFLKTLSKEHGIKNDQLYSYINTLANINQKIPETKSFKQVNFDKLNTYLKPEYYVFFQNLARVKDGVKTMVKIRQDLLEVIETKTMSEMEDDLKIMNSVLKSLLTLWFSIGLLNIQRIDWNSPASLVEKVAHYESVHQIKTLSDLKSRLSSNRRCFIYTHTTMSYEPLVILHIALTNEISSNIKDVLKSTDDKDNKCDYTNAIFYSINSCQKGLQQVDLGNALIKSAVRLLLEEKMPNLKNFHTLSPIPKFRQWIDLKLSQIDSNDDENLTKIVKNVNFFKIENAISPEETNFLNYFFKIEKNKKETLFKNIKNVLNTNQFRLEMSSIDLETENDKTLDEKQKLYKIISNFLKRSCAFYLFYEKKNGYAFNSVANFHLKNGAQIYRINFKADLSDNGWKSSYGFMVNYAYYLDELDSNCLNYLIDKKIKNSDLIEKDLHFFRN